MTQDRLVKLARLSIECKLARKINFADVVIFCCEEGSQGVNEIFTFYCDFFIFDRWEVMLYMCRVFSRFVLSKNCVHVSTVLPVATAGSYSALCVLVFSASYVYTTLHQFNSHDDHSCDFASPVERPAPYIYY